MKRVQFGWQVALATLVVCRAYATGVHPRKRPFNAANMTALLKDKSRSA